MTRISGVFWVALFFAALAPFAVAVVGPASANPADEIRTLLPKDGMPSIDDPKFATVREADRFMSSDEMVDLCLDVLGYGHLAVQLSAAADDVPSRQFDQPFNMD